MSASSSCTLSTELCRQGSNYLLTNWHHPYQYSPQPSRHTALGHDQASNKADHHTDVQQVLRTVLGSMFAKVGSNIRWIQYNRENASRRGVIIASIVQQCQDHYIFERDHTAGKPNLVAYCTDGNFDNTEVTSTFGAKVHVGGTTQLWYLGFKGKPTVPGADIIVYYQDKTPMTSLTTEEHR